MRVRIRVCKFASGFRGGTSGGRPARPAAPFADDCRSTTDALAFVSGDGGGEIIPEGTVALVGDLGGRGGRGGIPARTRVIAFASAGDSPKSSPPTVSPRISLMSGRFPSGEVFSLRGGEPEGVAGAEDAGVDVAVASPRRIPSSPSQISASPRASPTEPSSRRGAVSASV